MEQDRTLGHQLFLVSRAHHNLASKIFGQIGLCRGQPSVLKELRREEGVTQCELALRLELTPPSLSNLLNRLEEAGLVERKVDSLDSRYTRIFLTENGRSKLIEIDQATQVIDKSAFNGFSKLEEKTLESFLNRIHANLNDKIQTDMETAS